MAQKINKDLIKSSLATAADWLIKSDKSPEDMLGDLLNDVQRARLYPDGKTFVDLVPRKRLASVREEYNLAKKDPDFDLREFISRHFYDVPEISPKNDQNKHPSKDIKKHIRSLWSRLERKNKTTNGSLIGLPYKYVVPGGRFNEMFYWDSYFIMLGLAADSKWDMVEGMVKNFAYMIKKYGYVPTANRTYLLSRSQPPVFALMVRLLASHKGKKVIKEYLPQLITEHRFWMKGKSKLDTETNKAYRRIIKMPNGSLLNRYYDNKTTPRPESYLQDTDTANGSRRQSKKVFLHLRAAAESGWDFSSRWFRDAGDIKTIHTTDIIPVDLNSLLYILEQTIADGFNTFRHPVKVRQFRKYAGSRQRAIDTYLWNEKQQFYMDFDFKAQAFTKVKSLAAVYPLFVGISTQQQADAVADQLEKHFLKKGGLLTTLNESGQQWDAPNGWAPLQYMAVEGLKNYGHFVLANKIARRWVDLNKRVYKHSGRLIEKYDVVGKSGLGGGGEYTLQDGFGWTNGVLIKYLKDLD